MLSLQSIRTLIQTSKTSSSVSGARFFSNHRAMSHWSHGPGVASSPQVEKLYRVDNVCISSQINRPAMLHFNFLELLYFRMAGIQGTVMSRDVIHHQGSTRLIGTTSRHESALKLAKSWSSRNAILLLNPRLVQKQLIDVDATVKQTGTGFFTKISEFEHALTVLPVSAIKEVTLIQNGQTIANPLYIEPTHDVVEEFQTIFMTQMKFLERLYLEGKIMTASQRQLELKTVIEQTAEFFQARLGGENPFAMTLAQYYERYGHGDRSDTPSSKYSSATTVLEMLRVDGDELFMQNGHYRQLLGQKEIREAIERANEENGYGSARHSYSFD
ncbi:hypothetical protein [Legionella spiritensis]|uniref:hypothetical protein n=1 Tax=Legionella spiritensis TaxID=452 RepID=UPI000F6DAEFA|nr:hypothetical protein [Legionella spiritensis]VEG91376.1 Uncharacterised protein [Legionella spiritensis]